MATFRGDPDVVVLGAGPNGLTAAAVLAGAGLCVLVVEAQREIGGAVRSGEVTLPGYRHDLFSAFYPLATVGPIARLPLERYGLEWRNFARAYGGATPEGPGFALEHTAAETRAALARTSPEDLQGWDELWEAWRRTRDPLLDVLFHPVGDLAPLLKLGLRLTSSRALFGFVRLALAPARSLAMTSFNGEDARVFLAGNALHSDLSPFEGGSGVLSFVMLALGQEVGMPFPRGGAQALPAALRACIEDRGGVVRTGARVERILVRGGRAVGVATTAGEITARRAVLATIEPQQLFLRLIDEGSLPTWFLRAVEQYEWGTGMFTLNCALTGLPRFRAERLNGVGVLHLGESTMALAAATGEARGGLLPTHPFLVVGFHTLVDPTRAPAGGHTLWLETHVPPRIMGDAAGKIQACDWVAAKEPFTERVLDELERFAPGLRGLIAGTHALSPDDLFAADANLVDGDNTGGSFALHQQVVLRPVPGWFRHRTPLRGLYLGGASTHPGGGVHGGPGANAARILLGDLGMATRYADAFG
jgi:phytoene dehydrogenase-like protein